jgi:crossover junction endodeoxyribonuclease RuvC
VYFAEHFEQVLDQTQATTLVIESLFTAKNVNSVLKLSHVRGVAMMMAARKGLNVVEIPPATIKKNVAGYGRATKEQIQFMVQKLLRLKEPPKPLDCADALAIAICYLNQSRLMARIRNKT